MYIEGSHVMLLVNERGCVIVNEIFFIGFAIYLFFVYLVIVFLNNFKIGHKDELVVLCIKFYFRLVRFL